MRVLKLVVFSSRCSSSIGSLTFVSLAKDAATTSMPTAHLLLSVSSTWPANSERRSFTRSCVTSYTSVRIDSFWKLSVEPLGGQRGNVLGGEGSAHLKLRYASAAAPILYTKRLVAGRGRS